MAKTNEVSDDQFKTAVFEQGGHLVVDLGGIQEAKFEAIPKGIYDAEIDSAEFGMSQNSGAPMITLQIAITTDGDYKGRKLYTYWSFGAKALPFTKAAIGRVAPELLSTAFSPEKVCNEGTLLGKPCRIRVTTEQYQGEDRSKIAQVLPPSSGDSTTATNGGGKAGGFF